MQNLIDYRNSSPKKNNCKTAPTSKGLRTLQNQGLKYSKRQKNRESDVSLYCLELQSLPESNAKPMKAQYCVAA